MTHDVAEADVVHVPPCDEPVRAVNAVAVYLVMDGSITGTHVTVIDDGFPAVGAALTSCMSDGA